MRLRNLIGILILVGIAWFSSGCALTRYEVIPQAAKGPQGGQVLLIKHLGSGYVEFVAKPITGDEWLLQIFGYDKDMKPKMHYSTAKVEIVTPDEKKMFVTLWDTKPYLWNREVGHLESRAKIEGSVFTVHALLTHGRPSGGSHVDFEYPFDGITGAGK